MDEYTDSQSLFHNINEHVHVAYMLRSTDYNLVNVSIIENNKIEYLST